MYLTQKLLFFLVLREFLTANGKLSAISNKLGETINNASTTNYQCPSILKNLTDAYNFRTIYYINSGSDDCHQKLMMVPSVVLDGEINMGMELDQNSLVIVWIISPTAHGRSKALETILNLSSLHKLILLLPAESSISDIRGFLQYCWKNDFIDVLAISGHQVYSYELFPNFRLINLTDERNLEIFFPNKVQNLHGTSLTAPFYNDLPRIFTYRKDDHSEIGGYCYKIIVTFAELHNGTLNWVSYEHMKDWRTQNAMLQNRHCDLLPFTFRGEKNISLSYPVNSIDTCIIVPYSHELPRYRYLELPFSKQTWACIAAAYLLYCAVYSALTIQTEPGSLIRDIVDDVVRVILQQFHKSRLRSRYLQAVFVFILVFSMLTASLYQSGLSSFYTKSIPDHQIDTYSDLIESNLTVLMGTHTYELTVNAENYFGVLDDGRPRFPEKALKNILSIEKDKLNSHLYDANSKYGYTATTDKFELVLQLNQYTSQKIFHLSKMCYGQSYFFVPLHVRSPYRIMLDDFIHHVMDSGLLAKWKRDIFQEAIDAGILKRKVISTSNLRPLTMYDLQAVWIIFGLGCILNILVFIGEQLTAKFRPGIGRFEIMH